MQNELIKTLEKKRNLLGDLEKENIGFIKKYDDKIKDKHSIRNQICEVEHLIRLIRNEIDMTNFDTKRI
jgi:hypothetical protein